MRVHEFYKSISPVTALSGVAVAFISSQAHAASPAQTESYGPQSPNTPVKLLPNSTVFMMPPPVPKGSNTLPKVTDILGKAFNHHDLGSLYGAGSFGSCETTSTSPSHFEKNYSNFAYSCFESFKGRQAISFDERFQADPQNQGIATAPLGGRLQWTDISAGARGRLLQRSIQELAQRNKTLADIIQGRISFDFGLGSIWSGTTTQKSVAAQVRPRFVVEVQQPDPNQAPNKRKFLASIGKMDHLGLGSGKTSSYGWLNTKPNRAKRTLRETFEPDPLSKPVLEQVENSGQSPTPSSDFMTKDFLSSMKYLTHRAGLQQLPFTKMNMRAERRVVDGQTQFALRATESQDLFFTEFPDARKIASGNIVWGYRIPWQRHALNIRYDTSISERTTSYSYKIDETNKTDLSYNHKNNAISAGFVVSF